MLEWISWFIVGIVCFLSNIYMTKKIITSKPSKNIYQMVLIAIFISLINIYFILNFNAPRKMILNVVMNIIALKFIFDEKTSKIVGSILFLYIIYAISEIVFTTIFVYAFKLELNFFLHSGIGILISNIIIILITLCFLFNKTIFKFINTVVEWYSEKHIINYIIVFILVIFTILFFINKNYFGMNSHSSFFTTLMFFIGVITFIVGFFKEKTDNNKLTSEYDQLLNYVKTYEEVVELKGKQQHEYKNQLILIKGMIENKDKKLISHVNQLLETETENYETTWVNKLKNIPSGGLKGLIHYKIFEMIHDDIKVYVDISDCINNKKCTNYLNNNLEDISKILSVYLDNAREAAAISDKKYITIEVKKEDKKFEIVISNTFKDIIKLEKIDKEGYSTKGSGRGYGLSLVKEILSKHNEIFQFREFECGFYVQHLVFNTKNKKQN